MSRIASCEHYALDIFHNNSAGVQQQPSCVCDQIFISLERLEIFSCRVREREREEQVKKCAVKWIQRIPRHKTLLTKENSVKSPKITVIDIKSDQRRDGKGRKSAGTQEGHENR